MSYMDDGTTVIDLFVLNVIWTGLVAIMLPAGAQILWLMGAGLALWSRSVVGPVND